MEERKYLKKQLIKNMIYTFTVFTMLVLIFDCLIYKKAERQLYKEIDTELQSFVSREPKGKVVIVNPSTMLVIRNVSLKSLKSKLFYISTIIIITSAVASYVLSKRTLIPIFMAWEKQNEFVQNAAHELRTPLTIIQAKQQLLLKEPESKIIDKSEDIRLTINETRRLTKLVKELMILATADSNKLQVKKEQKNIDEVVKEVSTPYAEYAKMQNKDLTLNLNCNKEVNIDVNKIEQLMVILLDNAIKYTKENENIQVNTNYKDGKCIIEVADEGIGISDEQKKHIFETFYRADKARSRETGGTGLGLAIAQTIVKAHGGSIKVHNNTPKGTKFIVKI